MENEAQEFLKFLRHSEYSVVEQLHKQSAHISILTLLLSSETHRDVLMKVLHETYVTDDISVNKLDRLVSNISADNFISFSDDEIPLGGMGSTKALHITTRYKGYTLPGMLIDNGSALNVLPLSILNRLPIDSSHMKTCQNIVRAFDGTERKPDAQQGKKELERKQEKRRARLSRAEVKWEPMTFPHISSTFVVGGVVHPKLKFTDEGTVEGMMKILSINAILKEGSRETSLVGVCSYEPRSVLNNWTVEELLFIFGFAEDGGTGRKVDFSLRKIIEIVTLKVANEVKIGTCIKEETKQNLIKLLQEFRDVFVWSYQDMPGLRTDIAVHRIPIREECKPVQQKLRKMRPDVEVKIGEDVKKQFDAGFLQAVNYSEWVANVVPVPKKDGNVRMCVDYRDLNKASPKDNFPLPHIDTLVDNTAGYSLFSFMDGFSGYNQIKMHPEDMEKTTFITLWGSFCYKVMPFGLKNTGATYQRAMVTLFHDMMHKEIEVYVDDMISTSRTEREHVQVLRKLFSRLRKFQLKLNPTKCTFEPGQENYLVSWSVKRKLRLTQIKSRLYKSCLRPALREKFELIEKCDPVFRLLKKHNPGVWDDECQMAFDKIKQYLANTPVLVPPSPDKPLILYMTVFDNSIGCVLGQHDETGKKENAIYYLSKKFTECEMRYSPIEILCYALKAVKGSAIADFLASRALENYEPLNFDFPNKDLIYVATAEEDTPEDHSWKLNFDGASNAVEYEACIIGIRVAIDRKIKVLEVYGDSASVIYQLKGAWETRDPKLISYRKLVLELIEQFDDINFFYLPHDENQMADALDILAFMIRINEQEDMKPIQMNICESPAHCCNIDEEEERDDHPWYHDILKYVKNREYTEQATENDKRALRRLANDYVLDREILYKRRKDQMLLRCVDAVKMKKILEEVHEGIHVPPSPLHVMTSPWPFSMWGMDIIGPISPKSSNGYRFIFVVIDYFTKWVEAALYANVTKSAISKFLKKEIICRYGMPERIVSDNTLNLNNSAIVEVCSQFNIKHHNSSPYCPKMNGAVEATNKNIKKIVGKITETYKDWHEKLPFSLFAYRTSVRTSTGATPFSLVYGMEAVLPIEVKISSFRNFRGKWMPNWEGPYVVKKAFSRGALILAKMDGKSQPNPVNADSVKKYFA
ncbi:uncharacterized protein LOC108484965 [Gossypium arboreum]|uniref:uncharacterized protein LOC108484965 n=1 Tax=Gossypium arboreum TaxID=29729 RepID=UPI0008190CAC|nr:uncharacterized protein LOC108484965 [Gossypium arboreum]